MKFKILLLAVLLIPFVSSAQVYKTGREASEAAYEASAMKQCGKPSCIPDLELDPIVIVAQKGESTEAVVATTTSSEIEALQKENEELKAQIALLQQIITLLKTLAGFKQ